MWWLTLPLAVIIPVILLVVALVITTRLQAPRQEQEREHVRAQPTTPVTASFAQRPTQPLWTFTPPPSFHPSDQIAAGTDKYALAERLSLDGNVVVDVIDANNGRLLRTVNLARTARTAQYGRCVAARTSQRAACMIDTDQVVVVDLDAGTVLARVAGSNPVPSSDGFWVVGQSSDVVVSLDANGRERWRDRSTLGEPRWGSAVAAIQFIPDDLKMGDRVPAQFRRDTDGKVLLRTNQWGPPSWVPYLGGFAVADEVESHGIVKSPIHYYDMTGKQTATTPDDGWEPMEIDEFVGINSDRSAPIPSLPLLTRSRDHVGDVLVTDIAAANPATGRLLWSKTKNVNVKSILLSSGAGTAAMLCPNPTFQSDLVSCAFVDVATGAYAAADKDMVKPELIGSDGHNLLVLTHDGDQWTAAATKLDPAANGPVAPLWTHTYPAVDVPLSFAGKVYIGLTRVL